MMLSMYPEDPLARKQTMEDDDNSMDSEFSNIWFYDANDSFKIKEEEEFGNDIEWVTHEDIDRSLDIQLEQGEDLFAGEFVPFPSTIPQLPLEEGSQIQPTASDSSLNFQSCDTAEKLLMSFDTMSYSSPSPPTSPRMSALHIKMEDLEDFQQQYEENDILEDSDPSIFKNQTKYQRPSIFNLNASSQNSQNSHRNSHHSSSQNHSHHSSHKSKKYEQHSKTSPSKPSDKMISNTTMTSTNYPSHSETSHHNSSNMKKSSSFEPVYHGHTIGSYTPNARKLRLEKFHEKRKKRIWTKSIKYNCRKKLADDRPRVKGRFVRVLEHLQNNTNATTSTATTTSTTTSSSSISSSSSSSASSSPAVHSSPKSMTNSSMSSTAAATMTSTTLPGTSTSTNMNPVKSVSAMPVVAMKDMEVHRMKQNPPPHTSTTSSSSSVSFITPSNCMPSTSTLMDHSKSYIPSIVSME